MILKALLSCGIVLAVCGAILTGIKQAHNTTTKLAEQAELRNRMMSTIDNTLKFYDPSTNTIFTYKEESK